MTIFRYILWAETIFLALTPFVLALTMVIVLLNGIFQIVVDCLILKMENLASNAEDLE